MTDLLFPNGLSEISVQYDAILCDVWGVLHNGRAAFEPACAALQAFRETGKPVVLITNAPVQAEFVQSTMERVGVPDGAWDKIASSGDATRGEIERRAPGPAYRLGTDEGWEKDDKLFEGSGLEITGTENAKFIIAMGLRDQFHDHPEDYRRELIELASRELPMICANPDIQVRVGNDLIWCAGALARIYEDEGGQVIYPGKPYGAIYDLAERYVKDLLGVMPPLSRVLAIGDGPETDIKGANKRGLDALYVGTGLNLSGTGDFTAETNELLEGYGVSARYAMPELCW